jgi:hypothetical protein
MEKKSINDNSTALPPSVTAWGGAPAQGPQGEPGQLQQFGRDYLHYLHDGYAGRAVRGLGRGIGRLTDWATDGNSKIDQLPGKLMGADTAPVAPPSPPTPGLDEHGQSAPVSAADIGKGLMIGGGIGLGATGLYYLAKHLTAKRKKPQPAMAASVMPKMAGWDAQGLVDSITSLPGRAGQAVLGSLPKAGDLLTPSSDGWIQGGVNRGLSLLAPAAGIAGGGMLAASIAKKMRQRAAESETDKARQEYLDALTGAKAASLDAAYEKYASDPSWTESITNGLKALTQHAATIGTVAGGVGIPVGAAYMYNKTRNNALATNALKAQAMKQRMRALPGTWVDPEELAQIKQMAMANNAAAT